MNIQYYYNFVTIVESGSLTAAAEKLHIAQPALSNQIKALEQKYGTRLFYRGARKLELTDAGAILYQKAKFLCEVEIEAKNEIASGFSGQRGTLRLGISYSISNPKLIDLVTDFCLLYPDTDIKILEGDYTELMKLLQNGVVEAVITRSIKIQQENFDLVHMEEDDVVAVYAPDAGFLDDVVGDEVPVERLGGLPLSLQDRSVPSISAAFKNAGVACYVKCVSSRLQISMSWARKGIAIALVPSSVVEELHYEDLLCKKITGVQMTAPVCAIIAQQRKYRSPVIENFLHVVLEAMQKDKLLAKEKKQ